jgi:hypothetical protein
VSYCYAVGLKAIYGQHAGAKTWGDSENTDFLIAESRSFDKRL